MSFEVFDHTADLGLRVEAESFEELLADSGRALFTVIAGDLRSIEPRDERKIEIAAEDDELLLFDWLDELLALFETERFLCREFAARRLQGRIRAEVRGEALDVARHALEHEVKAITYHGLSVQRREGRYVAEVVVDI